VSSKKSEGPLWCVNLTQVPSCQAKKSYDIIWNARVPSPASLC
jgi:hypothetical protein